MCFAIFLSRAGVSAAQFKSGNQIEQLKGHLVAEKEIPYAASSLFWNDEWLMDPMCLSDYPFPPSAPVHVVVKGTKQAQEQRWCSDPRLAVLAVAHRLMVGGIVGGTSYGIVELAPTKYVTAFSKLIDFHHQSQRTMPVSRPSRLASMSCRRHQGREDHI